MINNISWGSYWFALTVLVILYYIYVLGVYYRSEIRQLLVGSRMTASSADSLIAHSTDQPADDNTFSLVQSFSNELSSYMEQLSYEKPAKNELLYGLQLIAKKYPGIYQSPYRSALDQLIQFESKDKCAVALDEDEIRQVWLV